ncbi:DUF2281 domain-containing protein [Nostoc sp. XA013]|nr:DUF2281 domain-containing protein [Nostoc sp. XA013]
MTIRETAIAKLQQLSEPLLQEVTDFIDFVIHCDAGVLLCLVDCLRHATRTYSASAQCL